MDSKLIFRFVILFFNTLPIYNTCAQNLIPNGDFELGPDSLSAGWILGVLDSTGGGCVSTTWVNGPDFWIKTVGTPDRFLNNDLPICGWTPDSAYSGNAYCQFVSGNNNYYEAGKAILISPFLKDSVYILHYCVSRQTFNGLGTAPSQIAFVFNNFNDSIASPLIYSTTWQWFDTIFSAKNNATEINVKAIYPIGIAGMNVDNLILQKWNPTGINEADNLNSNISVYPNPTEGVLNIKTKSKISNVEICDISGRVIFRDNKPFINISRYDKGVYFVKVSTDKKYSVQKIIIQ